MRSYSRKVPDFLRKFSRITLPKLALGQVATELSIKKFESFSIKIIAEPTTREKEREQN